MNYQENAIKPDVRFDGFADDWEQRKLGEVSERVQGNDGRMDLPTLTISAANGWMSQEDRFSGNIAGKEQKNYTLLHKGELSYNHGNSKLAKYGTVFSLESYEEALVPRVYHSFRMTKADSSFIEYYFATKIPDRELAKLISSGARMDGLLNISFDEFMGIKIKLPSVKEQKQIADYLRQLDNLITLHQRKSDALKEAKKFYLQNMFPQKGENAPRIRFEGFAGDWEQRKLIEISDIVTGTTPPTKDKDNYGGDRLFVSPADIQGNRYVDETITTLTEKGYALGRELRAGTTLFVSIGSTIGKVAQIKESATTNQQINAVIPNVEMDDNFVFTMLENEAEKIKKLAATQAVPIINKTTFGETEIQFPKKEEQTRIGEYFSNLDNLITLHQRKVDAYKKFKKSMMQKMFI